MHLEGGTFVRASRRGYTPRGQGGVDEARQFSQTNLDQLHVDFLRVSPDAVVCALSAGSSPSVLQLRVVQNGKVYCESGCLLSCLLQNFSRANQPAASSAAETVSTVQ